MLYLMYDITSSDKKSLQSLTLESVNIFIWVGMILKFERLVYVSLSFIRNAWNFYTVGVLNAFSCCSLFVFLNFVGDLSFQSIENCQHPNLIPSKMILLKFFSLLQIRRMWKRLQKLRNHVLCWHSGRNFLKTNRNFW